MRQVFGRVVSGICVNFLDQVQFFRFIHFATKLVAMATSLQESEKLDLIKKIDANTFHLVKNM